MSALSEPLQITEPFRGRNDLRRNLVGLSRDELKTTLVEAGLEPFRARQVWQWIYWHGVTDFGRMTNIAKKTQGRLVELFVIERPQIVTEQRSVTICGRSNGCCASPTATRPRRSTSPKRIAARSASRARSAAP